MFICCFWPPTSIDMSVLVSMVISDETGNTEDTTKTEVPVPLEVSELRVSLVPGGSTGFTIA